MNHKRLAGLLLCPDCGEEMRFYPRVFSYSCEGEILHAYRVKDEIADLVRDEGEGGRQRKVNKAFSRIAGRRYERIATGATAFDRFIVRAMWGTDKFIPLLFEMLESVVSTCESGFFLDIPVGTGVFTAGEYSLQPNFEFVIADYSQEMLKSAFKKVRAQDFGNVMPVRADACNLPFRDSAFTGIMTMNGIDAFPDKARALDELVRVLKPGGKLAGSFCIRGERLLTDILVGRIASWLGWFTRPLFTEVQFLEELEKRGITNVVTRKVKSILFFSGRKEAL